MELYGVYLRAYITAVGNLKVNIEGASLEQLAACAQASLDAKHGREPRTIEALRATVDGMLSMAVASCA